MSQTPTNADLNTAMGILDEVLGLMSQAQDLTGKGFRFEVNWVPSDMGDLHTLIDEVAEQLAAHIE